MKIISWILSLFFSDMKPEDISLELIFVGLFFKAGWVLLITLLNYAVKAFKCTLAARPNLNSRRFTLCHEL
ncbi:hypothetical protein HDF24_02955 [Mucilaginibacter sp. X4EP1]|uniref:hypothetical protein n=1 Tax=Mucilaginibacter sp. X4EP1 TaxID=2723092 RepID=UPI0021682DCF|nr:hypothetical protein [Mucilaginibacter sp. X4EP1]MCS3811982.1 hypothetical protein [Mucilaginibacter sp. X4EP1]